MNKDSKIYVCAQTGLVGSWDSTKPDGTPRKLLDVSRFKHGGWKPKISLEEGIAKTYEDYQRKIKNFSAMDDSTQNNAMSSDQHEEKNYG